MFNATTFFTQEICEKEVMNKKLNKYISTFDYVNQTLLILSAASIFISVTKYASALSLIYYFDNGVDKKFLKTKRKKRKKHSKVVLLAGSKLNIIKT